MNKGIIGALALVTIFIVTLDSAYAEMKKGTVSAKRMWNCAENPEKYLCTKREEKEAKLFLQKQSVQGLVERLKSEKVFTTKNRIEAIKKKLGIGATEAKIDEAKSISQQMAKPKITTKS